MLRRYELQRAAEQRFESLSGGQQARFQILLLELEGATLLLPDELTDNLDLESAEALEDGLSAPRGERSSPSPTTAGSCAASTASSCSTRTARSRTCSSHRASTAEAGAWPVRANIGP